MHTVVQYLGYLLGGYVGLMMGLFAISRSVPRAAFYARLLASYLSLIVCAVYGVLASIVLRVVGYGQISQWATARSFKWVMRYTTGVQVVIEGQEHLKTRPAVFIGNHQSELDVLVLGAMFPKYCSVTAKESLKRMPFLGWFMTLSRTVFIDRGNRENAMAAFASAAKEMRSQRQSVFIFPEGTRSYYAQPDLLPFKKGAFHLAVQAQVPIVPMVVANYSNVLHVPSRIFRSGTLLIKMLPPISTENLTSADVDELTQQTRNLILNELVLLTEKSRASGLASSLNASSNPSAQIDGVVNKATGVEYKRQNVGRQVASTF